ncbi:GPI mannosyltransferase 2 [Populus alba x Populus x berolinensis]|uniref:GPI mannosyltransferase 2 n=1 Tax=Populus alba x Populus x berolinensis TaxID=444605 RepID=A0AAD6RAS1_9ROSI|nr:GPI mannosyltransferase 2 [Populus alba x Populus x berolinensis]
MSKTLESPRNHQTLKIIKSAITSRLLLLSLILLWRTLIDPYDTSSPLDPDCLSTDHQQQERHVIQFPRIGSAIEDSIVWDSVYFVRIAQCGYEYEQTYAFLPLLPACVVLLSRTVLVPLVSVIGHRAVLALAGYLVNNVAFVLAAVYFYRYTESLYALLSLGGLYHLISGASNVAVLWFALSGCARSNGVLNAGYLCFQTMHQAYDAVFLQKRAHLAVKVLIVGALRCICVFIPFIAFQAYGYYNICHGHSLDETRPWCEAKIPLLYSYIQSHYWGVGFLRYFQLKQLPNFLVASPILSLAVCSVLHYVRSQPEIFFSLGFRASNGEKRPTASPLSLDRVPESNSSHLKEKSSAKMQDKYTVRQRKQRIKGDNYVLLDEYDSLEKPRYLSTFIVPCTLHLLFMAATAFFVMHVQVSTRFLSASPPLYWFASRLLTSPGTGKRWGYMIWTYSTAYILLGSLLFSNFYPFT